MLLDAVSRTANFQPAPEVVFEMTLAGAAHEEREDIELPVGHRDRLSSRGQTPPPRIQLEAVENEADAGRHPGIVSI